MYAVFDAWPIIHPIVLKSYVTLVSDEVQLDSHKVEGSKSPNDKAEIWLNAIFLIFSEGNKTLEGLSTLHLLS